MSNQKVVYIDSTRWIFCDKICHYICANLWFDCIRSKIVSGMLNKLALQTSSLFFHLKTIEQVSSDLVAVKRFSKSMDTFYRFFSPWMTVDLIRNAINIFQFGSFLFIIFTFSVWKWKMFYSVCNYVMYK